MPGATDVLSEDLDYYAILDTDPGATAEELRVAFRRAVLVHHPDRSGAPATLATSRTALLLLAWAELRDPERRRHYDRALERGEAATLAWPMGSGEERRGVAGRGRRPPRRGLPAGPSPWHQPAWRSVAGFRVPAAVFQAGPDDQRRWIAEHYVNGQDWRAHSERYWLRFAGAYFRDQGRLDDQIGALERLIEIEPAFDTLANAGLREAYQATDRHLAGATFLAEVGDRWATGSRPRAWVEREQRALLTDFRERRVRRVTPAARAANAGLLLEYLAGAGLEPTVADLRAAYLARRRAGDTEGADAVLGRLLDLPVTDGDGWYLRIQVLTEAGQLEQASALLAEVARGDHPEAFDPGRTRGQPGRRLAAARHRLSRAQARRS